MLIRIPKTALLVFLLTLSVALSAQKTEVSGILKDAVTGETLPLVAVFLDSTSIGANSNLEGEFTFYAPPGDYVLVVNYSGYRPFRDSISIGDQAITGLEVLVEPVAYESEGVVITSDAVNPAIRIVKMAIRNRKENRHDDIEAYEYEAYNKLIILMDNVTEKFLDSKMLKRVKSVVSDVIEHDTLNTDSSTYKIAVFVSESVSRFYFHEPDQKKEEILAVQTSGVKGSEYNLLSSMFLQIDLYDNFVTIVDRQFMSPIADGAFSNYDFELMSVEADGRDTLFGLQIIPKRPWDPVFQGIMYIDNKDWAINRIELEMNENPNINFVENVKITHEYKKIDGFWMPVLLDLEVDFVNSLTKRKGGKGVGLIGRTSSYMYDYQINEPKDPKFYKQEVLEIKTGAEDKDSLYWAQHRKSPLDESEQLGYGLVDSLKTRGVLDYYISTIRLLTVGTKEFKYFEVGPYFYAVGFNRVEDVRLRMGLYTTKEFSKRLYLGGHLAYGFGDDLWKYQIDSKIRLRQQPRVEIGLKKTFELEQTGFPDFVEEGTSLLATVLRRVPLTRLNYFHEHKASVYADISRGIAATTFIKTRAFIPAFDFRFRHPVDGEIASHYATTETGVDFRISFKEQYILSEGEKLYIGSDYPVFNIGYIKGHRGILDGEFDYHEVYLKATQKLRLGRWGYVRYHLNGGKIFGNLPYPALHVFRGNQTWGYDTRGFNLMNYYEFVADQYVTLAFDHHTEGYFWNKLPLLRKLKFKEVFTGRLAWGTLSKDNAMINNFSDQYIIAPEKEPYLEAGVGLENILKVLRFDAIWRLNYHTPYVDRFGVRVHFTVSF